MRFKGYEWSCDLWTDGSPKWVHVDFHGKTGVLQWWEAEALGRALLTAAEEAKRRTHLDDAMALAALGAQTHG